MVFLAEMLNQSIRRSTDLFPLIDRQLIVSIPYIATHKELQGKKRKQNERSDLLRGWPSRE